MLSLPLPDESNVILTHRNSGLYFKRAGRSQNLTTSKSPENENVQRLP